MVTTPRVSVIVPVYNDPEGITDTLDSLAGQTYPIDEFEVVVIDQGDGTSTRDAIERVQSRAPISIRALTESEPSAGGARNDGVGAARGEYLFFIDADEIVDPDWIAECVDRMDVTGALYAGCRVDLIRDSEAFATAAGRYEISKGINQDRRIGDDHFAITAALLTRRELFDRIGTFDPRLDSSEDRMLGNKTHDAGIELHYFDDIVVRHPPRTTIRELARQWLRIGRGKAQAERYYGTDLDLATGDVMTYIPNAAPWSVRQWATGMCPERNVAAWTYSTVFWLFVVHTILEYAQIVGYLVEDRR